MLIQTIIEEIENKRANWKNVVQELFCAVFLLLLRAVSPQPTADSSCQYFGTVTPALSYIAENYMNSIAIDELAQLCHLSVSHFRRLFKRYLGCTPQEYIQTIRMDRACVLLYNSDSPVTEIASRVGFATSSSFSRQFKKQYDISPNQWRLKQHRENDLAVTDYSGAVPPKNQHFSLSEHDSDGD